MALPDSAEETARRLHYAFADALDDAALHRTAVVRALDAPARPKGIRLKKNQNQSSG
jgi:hypothetical protein